jgi:hypothetical protein
VIDHSTAWALGIFYVIGFAVAIGVFAAIWPIGGWTTNAPDPSAIFAALFWPLTIIILPSYWVTSAAIARKRAPKPHTDQWLNAARREVEAIAPEEP